MKLGFFLPFSPFFDQKMIKNRSIYGISDHPVLTLAPRTGFIKTNLNLKNMDFKQIQELIKMVNKSNIGEVTIEQKDFKVTVKQKEDKITQVVNAVAPLQSAPVSAPPAPIAAAPAAALAADKPKPPASTDNLITIKSPMIGTFYRKSSPDKPNLVDIGAEISPGSVVCIIEAMKLFNEIESEIKGRVVKVLVDDASPVEYDQPLFLVEPA
jgi:acetyl-CoA carboxylase biotin carboxyl carrier protein